jgi:hypothetical protein
MPRTWSVAAAALICSLLSPHEGSAQTATVRVTAAAVTIRSHPDAQSGAVATVKTGTLLDVVARRGEWIEVRLPARPGETARLGFVPAHLVEVLPGAEGTPGRSGLAASPPPGGTLAADWQARHDRALEKRRAGRRTQHTGGIIGLAGLAANVFGLVKGLKAEEDEQQRYLTIAYAGGGVAATGAYIAHRGTKGMRAATREIMLLEAEREAAGVPGKVSWRLTTGSDTRVALTIAW